MAHAATTDLAVERWRRTSPLNRITLYSTFGLLLFAPLAFGTTEPWSIFILEAGAATLFALWAFGQATSGELEVCGNPLFTPMLLFGGLVLLQIATGRTAYRYETAFNLRLYTAYAILGFLLIQLLRRTSQVRILAVGLPVYGATLATFALIQGISSNGKLYWMRLPRFGGWIYGPYVNHNHYAGLMEMLVPIPLVLSLNHRVRGNNRKLAITAAAIMASSIFLSGSRGGMAAFTVQILMLVGFLLHHDRQKLKRTTISVGLFVVILMALLAWLGGSDLLSRIGSIHHETQTEMAGGTRTTIARDAVKMIAEKPALGWGLGTFPDVYPQFRSFYTDFSVNAAHDDYLQLLVETGLLGFAVMIWFVVAMYRAAIRKVGRWTSDTDGAVGFAAMLGCTGLLVHSFVDFNLQVPANAAWFYILAVVAAMQPRFGLTRREPDRLARTETKRSA